MSTEEFLGWHKIRQFSDAVAFARKMQFGEVAFYGTVKLHGTNAGCRVRTDGTIQPQSRNQKVNDGHFGFVNFCREREDEIRTIARKAQRMYGCENEDIVLFGEWIGPGIQKGVAINNLPGKQWVLFGARTPSGLTLPAPMYDEWEQSIYSLAEDYQITIDFGQPLAEVTEELTRLTLAVEEQCPWAKKFCVDGIGEGIVWRPADPELRSVEDLWFKTKGEKHAKSKVKSVKNITENARVSDDARAFVEEHLTERRLEQGLEALLEQGKEASMRNTKDFLSFVLNDLKDETQNELAASGLDWRPVGGIASSKAVAWLKERCAVRLTDGPG